MREPVASCRSRRSPRSTWRSSSARAPPISWVKRPRRSPRARQVGAGAPQTIPGAPTMTAQLQQAAANFPPRRPRSSPRSRTSMPGYGGRSAAARARRSRRSAQARTAKALQLVQQIESNVDQLRHFQETAVAGQGKAPKGMRAQLAALEHSIPKTCHGRGAGKGECGGERTPIPRGRACNPDIEARGTLTSNRSRPASWSSSLGDGSRSMGMKRSSGPPSRTPPRARDGVDHHPVAASRRGTAGSWAADLHRSRPAARRSSPRSGRRSWLPPGNSPSSRM